MITTIPRMNSTSAHPLAAAESYALGRLVCPGMRAAIAPAPISGLSQWVVDRSREAAELAQVWRMADHDALVRNMNGVNRLIQACYESWTRANAVSSTRQGRDPGCTSEADAERGS
jgi:hypothetical protein